MFISSNVLANFKFDRYPESYDKDSGTSLLRYLCAPFMLHVLFYALYIYVPFNPFKILQGRCNYLLHKRNKCLAMDAPNIFSNKRHSYIYFNHSLLQLRFVKNIRNLFLDHKQASISIHSHFLKLSVKI